jgi:large subunit ribosomal protein L13
MTTKTYRLHSGSMERRWHVIDAKGRPLGRLASEAAQLLMGKHKPTYEPHLAMGDFVVVVNAREIAITGNKATQKVYYRHSGYPGGLRERTFQEQLDRDPRRVVEKAIKGMLPSTSLGRELFRHLKVYSGPNHPHEAQVRAGTGARAKTGGSPAAGDAASTARRSERAAPTTEPTTEQTTAETPEQNAATE